MDAPIVRATIQAAILSGISNILAQSITAYRGEQSLFTTFNRADFINFILFTLISCPPNYIWQSWLEAQFPGYTEKLSPPEKEKLVDDAVSGQSSGVDGKGNGSLEKRTTDGAMTASTVPLTPQKASKKLNVKNTAIKFSLDQTIGAAVNTLLFIAGIALLRGYSLARIQQDVHEQFWPMIFAGQKLWPAVSVVQFTLVPFEYRTLVGSLVGLGWGVYLSLITGGQK
ncbi:hypothetical protein BAUCODRAFT_149744 [Baudoinia panamericana UAMH 10762]|uniref:Mpv17/PMP22 family protein n=1 Tax=Baudoinia panamericana (strain UAMH 10762) TaxID=717646 RepID=M2LK47_BAUPA|nr:uncharacterized protein BAUCODRAFT_149744 [Baudoinia panamericana UAMH 10762]EMC94612.1 hypothetical protein BAUCODRAFT_149744 [Baudoinia panamericana UAMH 10762]